MTGFADLLETARTGGRKRAAIIMPHDVDSLSAAIDGTNAGLIEPVLVGEPGIIRSIAEESGLSLDGIQLIEATDGTDAAETAVRLVRNNDADLLMKGLIDTSTVLKAVLNPDFGLRTGRLLSHVAVFAVQGQERLLLVTDAAMNVAPGCDQKQGIIRNAVEVARAVGVAVPMVAIICAKEKVDPRMPATLDAQELHRRNATGVIAGCVISGPLALDNAVSPAAAKQKGITDPVAGLADILMMPDIEAANVLYKALVFLAAAENAGIIVGAAAPVVLTSRADSRRTKLNSIAIAVLHAAIQ